MDGNVVAAAGVSAGIAMALWLIGQIYGDDLGRSVTGGMKYDPPPAFAFACGGVKGRNVRDMNALRKGM